MKTTAATLSGVVLDAAGQPVALARVYLTQAPGAVPDTAALTAADGSFSLAAPQLGSYVVACQTDALGGASARVQVGAAGAWVALRLGR